MGKRRGEEQTKDLTESNAAEEQRKARTRRARYDQACLEKGELPIRSESCESMWGTPPITVIQPQSFNDWQHILRERANAKENEKGVACIVIETDTCFQHADKRMRVTPDICEDQEQIKAVPISSEESRSYRHQQESSDSSNGFSTTSVEPKWSDSDEDNSQQNYVISATEETESLSTVLSQQMDYISLSGAAAESIYQDHCEGEYHR